MGKIVTIGEVYFVATTIDKLKFEQSAMLGFTFKGSEMSVAASLSKFGVSVSHITAVSDDILGEAAVAWMTHYGVDVSFVKKNKLPIPMCFVEEGIGIRSSRVATMSLQTAFESLDPKLLDWSKIFQGCSWIFWSSASVNDKLSDTIKAGLDIAELKGVNVLADLSLHNPSGLPWFNENKEWTKLLSISSTVICGVKEMNLLLGNHFGYDKDAFIDSCLSLTKEYPEIINIFDKITIGSKCYGRAFVGGQYFETKEFEIGTVLENNGTAEAFSAALLYALRYYDEQQALNFATASYALKHTIYGDYNTASVDEVLRVLVAKDNKNTHGAI